MVFNLSEQNSIVNQFVAELRDRSVQTDRMKFRKNLERIGQIMAYEISKKLTYEAASIITPLGRSSTSLLNDKPVLITVMRAGLPYFHGFTDYFDGSDCGFIGAYRQEGSDQIVINLEYVATPSLKGKTVILIDPMLATGNSIVRSVNALNKYGTPAHIHIASLVAVPAGVEFVEKNMKSPYTIWTCAIDDELNEQFYIVPGLGDAGDLSFGEKI